MAIRGAIFETKRIAGLQDDVTGYECFQATWNLIDGCELPSASLDI